MNFYEGRKSEMETGKLLLDIREAAHAVCLSPWTIRKWIADGKLKAVRLGRRVLLEPAELQRLVEAGRNPRPASGGDND